MTTQRTTGLAYVNGQYVDPATLTPEQVDARWEELTTQHESLQHRLSLRNRSINFHGNTLDGIASDRKFDRAFDAIYAEQDALRPYLKDYCLTCGCKYEWGCDCECPKCATR